MRGQGRKGSLTNNREKCIEAGKKFNSFQVIEYAGRYVTMGDNRPQWKVECDCGKVLTLVNRRIREYHTCGPDCGLQ